MEEITLTHGQFQILLAGTLTRVGAPEVRSLVKALHKARIGGHLWRTKMTEGDIETALGIFKENQRSTSTPGAKKAWQFFVRDSPTAYRLMRASEDAADVPRETSPEETT